MPDFLQILWEMLREINVTSTPSKIIYLALNAASISGVLTALYAYVRAVIDVAQSKPNGTLKEVYVYDNVGAVVSATNLRAKTPLGVGWITHKFKLLIDDVSTVWILSFALWIINAVLFLFLIVERIVRTLFLFFFLIVESIIHFIGIFLFLRIAAIMRIAEKAQTGKVRHNCPQCKHMFPLPLYVCPNCGTVHSLNFVSSKYGILFTRCQCRTKIPISVFSGKFKLSARCPACESELPTGGTVRFYVHVVGACKSGKTAFIRTFIINRVEKFPSLRVFPDDSLQRFKNEVIVHTQERNAIEYSFAKTQANGRDLSCTSLYDISGEVYESENYDTEPIQFDYCDGFVALIDPSSPHDTDDAIRGFINKYKVVTGRSSSKLSPVPLAAVISKADSQAIKLAPGESGNVCREYLEQNGMQNICNMLESCFGTVQYFTAANSNYESIYNSLSWLANKAHAAI